MRNNKQSVYQSCAGVLTVSFPIAEYCDKQWNCNRGYVLWTLLYRDLMIEIRCALQKRTFSSKTSSLYFLWRVELHMEPHVLLLRARRPWLTLSGVARVLAHSTRMYSTKLKNKYGALCKYGLTHFHAAMSCGWQSPTAPPCSLSAKTSQQCVCVRVTGHTHTHSFWSVSGSSMNVNWY